MPEVGSGVVCQPPEAHFDPVVAKFAPVAKFSVFVPAAGVWNAALSIVSVAVPSFYAMIADIM